MEVSFAGGPDVPSGFDTYIIPPMYEKGPLTWADAQLARFR
jgi:hypothetical protein